VIVADVVADVVVVVGVVGVVWLASPAPLH
jgi:hypothetical protein